MGAHWNAGIAATALSRWRRAREAWRACGIDVELSDAPIEMSMTTPIRIDPRGAGEVVWCTRICPARAIIENIPTPESGHRYRDLLLHDGAPNGSRLSRGREVPVFDELVVLEPSRFETWVLEIDTDEARAAEIVTQVKQRGGYAEDWTTSVRMICKACSEGTVGYEHNHETAVPARRRIGIATTSDELCRDAAAWVRRLGSGHDLRRAL